MDEDTLTVTVLRGFLRFCAYADRLRVTVEQGAVLDCAPVPSGIPGGLSEGGLGSRGDLDVRGGAAIHGTLRSLAGDILVGRDAVVTGTVAAGSDVKADRRSQIGSSIQSGHRVELGRDVMVLGDVTAADSVKVDPRATVTGEIKAFADVAPIPDVTWVQFSFEPGSEKVTVQKDSSRTLNPGSYGDVAVKKDATLILVSGQYVFDKFQLDQGAQLEFDLSAGAVVIDVAQNLDFGNDVQMQVVSAAGDAQDILFRVAGTVVDLGEGGVFLGTFLAPDAQIQMRQEASLNGAVYGRMVRVQQHAHLTGMPARDLCASLLVNP
jgi:cytoskeletal protein CcmA (bactofilin family)